MFRTKKNIQMKNVLISLLFVPVFSFAQFGDLKKLAESKIQKITNENPYLNKKGKKRAVYWSEVFQHVNFDMIFSTNYKRTIATASPTAISKKLKIKLYDAKKLYSGSDEHMPNFPSLQ